VNDLEGTFRATEIFSQSESELPGSNNATTLPEVEEAALENNADADFPSPLPAEHSRATQSSPISDAHAKIVATGNDIAQEIPAFPASTTSTSQEESQSAKFGINWQAVSLIPLAEFVALLLQCAKNLKLHRYPKAKPRKRNPQQKRITKKRGQHVSTYRILNPQEEAL
jgi:hypothetical protein